MQLLNFLQEVLPRAGKRCAVQIDKTKKVTQTFYDTNEQLAARLLEISASGHDAYFAIASFDDARKRKRENVIALRELQLDVDCGTGKPYPDYQAGLRAVDDFCDIFNLPYPLAVKSGYGVHVYWLLAEEVPLGEWLPAAQLLKQRCAEYGLQADPSRTADPASILRPPGTFNYKREPQPVEVIEGDGLERISLQDFADKLGMPVSQLAAPVRAAIPDSKGISEAILGSSRMGIIPGGGEGSRNANCAHNVGIWAAQKLSFEEVRAKAHAWNETNTPPMDEAEVDGVVRSIYGREQSKPPATTVIEDIEFVVPPLPENFSVRRQKMWFDLEEDGKKKSIIVASYPCYLIDVCRKERENFESYVFNSFHPKNGWHKFLISREDFESPRRVAIMGKNCTEIVHDKLFHSYVRAAAVLLKETKMDSLRYEQFGWKDNHKAFLVGNTLYRVGEPPVYAYGDENLEPRAAAMKLPKNGSLAAWTAEGDKLFAAGSQGHGLGLVASFASPLMQFVSGATDGGVILALHTPGSGYGKSNILQAVSSVWGQYDALALSGNDTTNAMFNKIARACHLPCHTEELGKRDPVIETQFIKGYIMGKEKDRSGKDGTVQFKNTRFNNLLISASNHSLADVVRSGGDQGAMARIFEIQIERPADKEAFKEFSRITATMMENYGFAGRTFVTALMKPGCIEWVKHEANAIVERLMREFQTDPKDRYILYFLACCEVASIILNEANILHFNVENLMKWAKDTGFVRIKQEVVDPPIEILNQFINENIMDCLVVEGDFTPKKPLSIVAHPKSKLTMRMEKTSGRLFIPAVTIRRWLEKNNHHYGTIAQLLRHQGVVLEINKHVTLGAGTDYANARVRCWEVDMARADVSGIPVIASNKDAPKNKLSIQPAYAKLNPSGHDN